MAHSYSRGVCVLSFPRTADPEQLHLTSSGLSEAVGCMQPRLGMEAWGHEEVTQPENVGFHLPKDLRRQESLIFKIIDLLRVSGLVDWAAVSVCEGGKGPVVAPKRELGPGPARAKAGKLALPG